LATFDLALPPAERLGALVMPPEKSFNGLTQLAFALEASSVEGFALQKTKHDFDLIQPTG
jgi:hypothetical protein